MEAMRKAWTDERLDYLNHRVDDGFRQVNERFGQVDTRFDRVDAELGRVNERIDGLYRGMYQVGGGIIVALVGLIATQI